MSTPATTVPDIVMIFRGLAPQDVVDCTHHLVEAGLTCVEVSLTSEQALTSIQRLAEEVGDRCVVGAGTVLTTTDLERVAAAGARVALSPVTDADVIAAARDHGLAAIPGAFTPTEMHTAHRLGAAAVKLFPAAAVQPDYVRLVLEPLPDLRVLVTGGVRAETAREFFDVGAVSVGVGLGLLGADAVARRDWAEVARRAVAYRDVVTGPTPPATASA